MDSRSLKVPTPEWVCAAAPHLHQLHQVLKVLLLVDGELAVVVDDAVVLHLPVTAHTQGVVSRVVGALPHQEQARLRGVQEPLRLLSSDLPMEPPGEQQSLSDTLMGANVTLAMLKSLSASLFLQPSPAGGSTTNGQV